MKPRDLRTTEATLEFLRGATVEEVQLMLGHTTPHVATRPYINVKPRVIQRRRENTGRTARPATSQETA